MNKLRRSVVKLFSKLTELAAPPLLRVAAIVAWIGKYMSAYAVVRSLVDDSSRALSTPFAIIIPA